MYVTPPPTSWLHMTGGFIRVKFDTNCENTSPLARLRVQACQWEISMLRTSQIHNAQLQSVVPYLLENKKIFFCGYTYLLL